MSKQLRVISLGFPFANKSVIQDSLETDRALFDFDVVVIRPPQFTITTDCNLEAFKTLSAMVGPNSYIVYQHLESVMSTKRRELAAFFRQGGVLVVLLIAPSWYQAGTGRYGVVPAAVNNYEFLEGDLAVHLKKGTGSQITYRDPAEPFVGVLKKSTVTWAAYVPTVPAAPLNALKFFAFPGAAGALAGKMPYNQGHLILLPNVARLDEGAFLEACAEYRFKRQGSTPPKWIEQVSSGTSPFS